MIGSRISTNSVRSLLAITLALVLVLLTSATARATGSVSWSGNTVTFTAGDSDANRLGISFSSAVGYYIQDTGAPIQAGTGCVQAGTSAAACGNGFVTSLSVNLGNLGDEFRFDHYVPSSVTVNVTGGSGSDTIEILNFQANLPTARIVANGGSGNDVMRGGDQSNDFFTGGTGNDTFSGGSRFGGGNDTVSYTDKLAAVNASIGGASGVAGESDSIEFTIESIIGSSFGDTLVGTAWPQILDGRGGDDVLVGESMDDTLIGGSGRDWVYGDSRTDSSITGNDTIRVQNNDDDRLINCGPGTDQVIGDAWPLDWNRVACE